MIYGKTYNGNDEDARRQQVFEANVQTIQEHNAKNETWTKAVNVLEISPMRNGWHLFKVRQKNHTGWVRKNGMESETKRLLLRQRIGSRRVLSTQSWTKVRVKLAGLIPQQHLWSLLTRSKLASW